MIGLKQALAAPAIPLVLASLILVLTSGLLIQSFLQSLPGSGAAGQHITTSPVFPDGVSNPISTQWQNSVQVGNTATVLIEPLKVNDASSTMALLVDVVLGQQLQSHLADAHSLTYIAQSQSIEVCHSGNCSTRDIYSLQPQYAHDTVTVHLFGQGAESSDSPETTYSLSLSDMFSPFDMQLENPLGEPIDRTARIINDVPAVWDAQAYPSDTMYTYLDVSVDLPPNIVWHDSSVGINLPLQVAVAFKLGSQGALSSRQAYAQATGQAEQLRVNGQASANGQPDSAADIVWTLPPIKLMITRSGADKAYLYSVALVPILLLIILGQMLVAIPENEKSRSQREVAVGMLALILTVLPLHAVLVPQAAPALTRVDRILGFDVAALLFAAALIFWRLARRPEVSDS